jgi:hypothetical protein
MALTSRAAAIAPWNTEEVVNTSSAHIHPAELKATAAAQQPFTRVSTVMVVADMAPTPGELAMPHEESTLL